MGEKSSSFLSSEEFLSSYRSKSLKFWNEDCSPLLFSSWLEPSLTDAFTDFPEAMRALGFLNIVLLFPGL